VQVLARPVLLESIQQVHKRLVKIVQQVNPVAYLVKLQKVPVPLALTVNGVWQVIRHARIVLLGKTDNLVIVSTV
tara:strand:- start:576 stop:800 length:225 start_codon:yes stop_codon:yes gene_type:complete